MPIKDPASSPALIPDPKTVDGLTPSNAAGAAFVLSGLTLVGGGVALATQTALLLWAIGQVLIGFGTLQWFCLLHEAGHGSLFRARALNRAAGHLAGILALIPFSTWRLVHAGHHRWTGWQDRDSTTESLAPRTRGRLERQLANLAWRTWLPLFSIAYRWNNFWNVRRLEQFHRGRGSAARRVALVQVLAYGALAAAVGPVHLLWLVGPGVVLGLAFQDPLILSQHTHIPMPTAGEETVRPRLGTEQTDYTRSVDFPRWIGLGLLCGTGEHERHHAYPQVPGYRLHQVPWTPPRRVSAWRFLRGAKRLSGERFLFENSNTTEFQL